MIHCLNAYKLNLISDAACMGRQAATRKQNRTIGRGIETQNEVDYVCQPRSHNKQHAANQTARNRNTGFMKESRKSDRLCFWCGRQNHDRKYCPARDTTCNNCNKPCSPSVSARILIPERYIQQKKKRRNTYNSSVRSDMIRTIALHT